MAIRLAARLSVSSIQPGSHERQKCSLLADAIKIMPITLKK
jgi:hypothetical protein